MIKKYSIGDNFNPQTFTFFGDKMATIDYREMSIGRRLLLFDAKTISIIKSVELPNEPYGDKVIVSPDGSKLYVEYGPNFGVATITIFDASTLNVINTIKIPYLDGFASVYKINMDTDKLIGILDLIDLYESQNIRGWSPFGLAGVALSPTKDKLFVVSGDAHSMYA